MKSSRGDQGHPESPTMRRCTQHSNRAVWLTLTSLNTWRNHENLSFFSSPTVLCLLFTHPGGEQAESMCASPSRVKTARQNGAEMAMCRFEGDAPQCDRKP